VYTSKSLRDHHNGHTAGRLLQLEVLYSLRTGLQEEMHTPVISQESPELVVKQPRQSDEKEQTRETTAKALPPALIIVDTDTRASPTSTCVCLGTEQGQYQMIEAVLAHVTGFGSGSNSTKSLTSALSLPLPLPPCRFEMHGQILKQILKGVLLTGIHIEYETNCFLHTLQ
jgi:hypothetical protein